MKDIQFIDSNMFTPKDSWDLLSMAEKSEIMKVAVRNGITKLQDIRDKYNEFAEGGNTVGELIDAIYQNNPKEEFLGEPSHHYDFTQSEEWANAHGYYPDTRGHRDDRVKKPAHPSHPFRGTWNGDKFELTDFGMQNPNYTLFGLNDGGQDPQAVLTYQGGSVLPEITVTPNGNYILNPYDNIKIQYANGGNLYAGGSYMPSEGIKKRISKWEGKAMTGAKDPLSGKFLKNNSFESEAAAFTQALPESIREQVLSNPELADNLFSYSYNVGAPKFKKRVVKALEDYYAGKGTAKNIADSMWASGDAKLRGLRNRREEEKKGVLNALRVVPYAITEQPVSTAVINPFILPAENTTFFPQVTPVEDNYVEVQEITPEQRRAEQVRNTFDAINSYNRMMDMLSVPNNPAPVYRPKNAPYVVMGLGGPIVEAAMNEYKKGGGIHIKPSHRGRLTELKKRTGKTEAELYNDGNPAHKKMVVFARNARKFKHGLGGNLFSGEEEGSQQMITTHKPYYDRDGILLYNRTLPETVIIPDSQLSPAERNYRERQRQKNLPDYAEYKDRETTAKQIANAQKEWENSFEKQALNYGQAIASGVGMGADMVSRLPIYSSLKGASTLSRAETPLDYVESGLWLAPIVGETINGTYQAAKPAVENFLVNHPALYQYPRYAIGKFKYGFDAELPTLYRKVKTLPKVENGRVQISNPDNRFAYENGYGEESPIITNFTTDAPVRSHSAGNWDRGLTLAFPGRTLLGKHVISTRPSDTFTFGDNISVPVKDVTAFSGRPKEIASMDNAGVRTVTSPDAEMFWGIDSRDLGRRISEARETIQKINAAKAAGNRMVLLKPKMPIENFSNYSRAIEDLTRETFKSPTTRDYQFMDYVFRPKYDSQIMPVINDITFDVINKYPLMGEWVGNTERLRYLDDPSRWQNLMYDPLTTAESDFRGTMNIGLKPDYKK